MKRGNDIPNSPSAAFLALLKMRREYEEEQRQLRLALRPFAEYDVSKEFKRAWNRVARVAARVHTVPLFKMEN